MSLWIEDFQISQNFEWLDIKYLRCILIYSSIFIYYKLYIIIVYMILYYKILEDHNIEFKDYTILNSSIYYT